MGLAERRAVELVKETEFKMFEGKVKEICGVDVKLTFDWSAVESHKDCVWICENKKFDYYMWDNITTALTAITADNMGKEAVKNGLKAINMIPVAGELEFTSGVLTVRNDLTGNGAYDAGQIQSKLESGL